MSARFALVIHPDASFKVTEWEADTPAGLDTIYREIDSPNIGVIDIAPDISMWLDDDGNNGGTVNTIATAIYAATAPTPRKQYGTAVFTGIDPRGDTTGLTRDRCVALLEIAGIITPQIPHPRAK
ncbi:hypothetical protein OQI_39145 [Streptomyces pharetrae CZA14]|uniref:DUF3846 domain-containing protein n=1 Tax=Streptomyces pharetrae CZA14 TaxID=1144883 RepID=A0ABX3Y7B7_9ACTN|nr:hypothetical protein OQI_39145 [Streptomyces pharetrae CZA14]